MTYDWEHVPERLQHVRQQINRACQDADRDPGDVQLIAVAKSFPPQAIVAAWQAGQRDFGENRVQEALAKLDALPDLLPPNTPDQTAPRIHLIGQLQRNKARHAGAFASVHSIDSIRLAQAVSRRLDPDQPPLPVLLEINVAREPSKTGFDPDDTPDALTQISALPNLRVDGLMTIAPLTDHPEDARPIFRALRQLRDQLQLAHLSMGMSNDYAVAIAEGATIVRIGRAIFGERPA